MIKLIKKSIRKLSKPRNLLFLGALFLLLAFSLHAVVHHEHPYEIFGNNPTQAYLHGGDKKYWWMIVLAAYLFIAGAASLLARNQLLTPRAILPSSFGHLYLRVDLSKLFDPLRKALREGRLQRKICD